MAVFEIPLDIPDVIIEKVEINNDNIKIYVKSTVEGTICHICGRHIIKPHGHDKVITLRHLSILGKTAHIFINPARYKCPYCYCTTTQKLSWYNVRSPHTKAFEQHILSELINSTVEDTSIKNNLGYEAVMGIINRNIADKADWVTIKKLDVIGIDEITLKKGHKDFVVIITGRAGKKLIILGVLKDRKKATVKAFLKKIPGRLKKMITAVCTDMYDGFVNAAKEIFGKKVVVIDRFHVAKLYRKGIDKLRKKELKRLKEELSEVEYKKLKGAMWALRKSVKDLTEKDKAVLECLFKHSPLLKTVYKLTNDLTDIFEKNISKEEAKKKIKKWELKAKKSALDCFDSFISTLDKYMDGVTNYFKNRYNSGFVEGLNNKIKVIKRRCYGILNINHLFRRIYLDIEGYDLYC